VSARGEAIAEPGLARPVARERAQAGRAARSADVVRGGR